MIIDLYNLILAKVGRVSEMDQLAHVSVKSIRLSVDVAPKVTEKKDQKKVAEAKAASDGKKRRNRERT